MWDFLNKTAIVVTVLWIPSIVILYYGIWKNTKTLFTFSKNLYLSRRLSGEITFNYSNNDGKYILWSNEQLFELKFSKASDVSIHIYKDPPSIEWIWIANWIYDIWEVKDVTNIDMSSRTRALKEWEIVILKNIYWNYCAIKILDIKDNTRSDSKDEITFKYVINSDWYKDFS